ncbi:MAG: hypothetical protein F4Y94_11050 [Chloroflexi bacterium]|nr:hypothetical protein [Chloroflexota bacterium]
MPGAQAMPLPVARRAAMRVPPPIRRARLPLWIWVGVVGLATAAALPVLQSSDATATGAELRALERHRAAAQAEVRALASQVGELTSLERIAVVAETRLGLTPARPTVLLTVDTPPPERLLPARFLPRRAEAAPPDAAWWQRLLEMLIVR